MAFIIGKLRCCLCGQKDGILESVCDYGIYGDVGGRIFYHIQCLQLIEITPEKYGHIMADKAIMINDRIKECIKFNDKIEKTFDEKVQKLMSNHFERMLPYWSRKR